MSTMSTTPTSPITTPITSPIITDAPSSAEAATVESGSSLRRPLSLLGGLCLAAAPLLIIAGTLTSPPQASNSSADYITSLARDPFLTHASATFYHYGWIAMAFGILAGIGLVRGRKGRVLTLVGGLLSAFGAIQISGLLLADWFLESAGNHMALADAVAMHTGIGGLAFTVWMQTGRFLPIFVPIVFYAGLARAGVIHWALVPLTLLGMFAGFLIPGLVPGVAGIVLATVVGLACNAAVFVTAARLINRGRLGHA